MKEYSKAVRKADIILYTIIIFWVSISIWASFASLEEVTSGQGRIIASSKIQIIQNLEGGIIDDIFVKSGDIVSKDEALIQLNTTRFVSELSALEKEKIAAEKNLSLLNEEKEILLPLVDQGVESRMELIRLLQRISEAEAQLLKAEEMEPILKDRLERSTVKAPMDGIVNRVLFTTSGGVVQPGEAMAEFLIEVEVSPKDIAYVLKGQEAIVKLTAFDFAKFGSMTGTVINVGADSIQKEDGSIWYICEIAVDKSASTSLGKSVKILPGMIAQVDIISGEKTVMEYLLQPVTKIANEAFRER